MIIHVALDVPLDTLFDYQVEGGEAAIMGRMVLVPFGKRHMVGVVLGTSAVSVVSGERLKPVIAVLHDIPPLPADVIDLLRFCANYYHYPLGRTIFTALPVGLRRKFSSGNFEQSVFSLTVAGQQATPEDLPARAVLKCKVLLTLKEIGAASRQQIRAISPRALQVVKEFVEKGWAEEKIVSFSSAARKSIAPSFSPFVLNPAQQVAVTRLLENEGGFRPWLLYGVTGSGKTEVYLHLIAETVRKGRQVLVLVPEINLTPQLESRFRSRLPDATLVTLHSGLQQKERLQNWLLAQSGKACIVLGTRLAVFAPMPKLALIVVDEEHDSSFKQQEGLCYSARDVAIIRAKWLGITVLMGSATPALESYYNARRGRYRLLQLPSRAVAEAAMPVIHLIDVRRQKLSDGLSAPLLDALRVCLERGEQSLIFLNRRGYAPILMCGQCGWLSGCPRCSGRLVVHLREKLLRCHYCGHKAQIPPACPKCGDADLMPVGEGTQRLENTLAKIFPQAHILRIDRDSTRPKNTLSDLLDRASRADILVGTQMLAKGHDFPRLTLVGVVNVDSALYSTDFRASERLFALLLQVSGRAGRASASSQVMIQTCFPEHPLFEALRQQDYFSFADALLAERSQAGFPPFCFQAVLRAEAPRMETALHFLDGMVELSKKLDYPVTVYDPVEAIMPRIAGKSRARLLVQSASRSALQEFLARWLDMFPTTGVGKIRRSLDVDPLEF